MKDLSNKIRVLRENLARMGMEKGLRHSDVLELSQQLDILIVKYQLNRCNR
ncbi:hypothetical protein Ga0466249_004774 [Sporomusaceae bacterium BoRhaA]|uniref:aspartyl-phosphate phosphatase Spo0E family protein n=1 Tax=Pelorhabdus rhamnosifermentans TaxID=2772457 RepID=UPI001C061F54|nr:hypothetical protein [Pelorhabdus rhamnosifermentans]